LTGEVKLQIMLRYERLEGSWCCWR